MRIFLYFIFCITAFYNAGCAGCSNSNKDRSRTNQVEKPEVVNPRTEKQWTGISEIKMVQDGGIYKIPIEVNDAKMVFIFDTGASSICISETEARFLVKQGTLNQNDVIGETSFSDANGNISFGMVVILKSVKIGDRTLHNVEALIVPNDKAPLLLGQTALAQFGKISIDYKKCTIRFE